MGQRKRSYKQKQVVKHCEKKVGAWGDVTLLCSSQRLENELETIMQMTFLLVLSICWLCNNWHIWLCWVVYIVVLQATLICFSTHKQ